jgi:hypothetical protein
MALTADQAKLLYDTCSGLSIKAEVALNQESLDVFLKAHSDWMGALHELSLIMNSEDQGGI